MIVPGKPANELERIADLNEYDILDTLPEKEYDDITRIAADICGTPISLLTLVDTDRQWFKSRVGHDSTETGRDVAFCAHAILDPERILEVGDASKDERFFDNPNVTGAPHIAFYAGVPLVNSRGAAVGALCVIDQQPRTLSEPQRLTLRALARQIVAYLEVRRLNRQLALQQQQIEKVNLDLSRFAHVVAHDIKSPCSSMAMGIALIRDKYATRMNKEGLMFLDILEETSMRAIGMVNGILEHTQAINKTGISKERFLFGALFEEVKKLMVIPADFLITSSGDNVEVYSSKYILIQILMNLCNNAIKYNDKDKGLISVSVEREGNQYHFSVKDNGQGIAEKDQQSIFDLFSTLGVTDRFNHKGTGIGLSTVQRLVEKLDGTIKVISAPGMGSSFEFTIPA